MEIVNYYQELCYNKCSKGNKINAAKETKSFNFVPEAFIVSV